LRELKLASIVALWCAAAGLLLSVSYDRGWYLTRDATPMLATVLAMLVVAALLAVHDSRVREARHQSRILSGGGEVWFIGAPQPVRALGGLSWAVLVVAVVLNPPDVRCGMSADEPTDTATTFNLVGS